MNPALNYIIPDFETSNLNKGSPHDASNYPVCLVVLTCDNGLRRISYFDFSGDYTASATRLARLFESRPRHLVVGHGFKFDLHWFWRLGIDFHNPVYDTTFLPYLKLGGTHKKGDLTLEKLSGKKMPLGDFLVHKLGMNPAFLSPSLVKVYCKHDVLATESLFLSQMKELSEMPDPIFLKAPLRLMCALLPLLAKMEKRGFKIDLPKLTKIYKEQSTKKKKMVMALEGRIGKDFGLEPFNANSPAQVSQFIYSLRLKPSHHAIWKNFYATFNQFQKNPEATFEGKVAECFEKLESGLHIRPPLLSLNEASLSSDKDSLKTIMRLNPEHPHLDIVKEFYEISKLDTLIGTYLEGILGNSEKKGKPKPPKFFIHQDNDAYLHTSYAQTFTRTGRLNSFNPAMQNWPREGTFPVKSVVVSRFTNGKIASADASQIELRVGGFYHHDDQLKKDYITGLDIHSNFAKEIFGKGFTDEQRTASKQTVFKVWYWGSAWGIVNDPKIPLWDMGLAKALVATIENRYLGVTSGRKKDLATVKELGYLIIPEGKIFYIDPNHFSCKNKVANYPIQWGAFALMACGLLACEARMRAEGLTSLLIGTVHDDMIFDVFPGEEEKVKEIALWALDKGAKDNYLKFFRTPFDFPLGGGFKIGDCWK